MYVEQMSEQIKMEKGIELNESKLIVVTGFGPFIGHEDVNASWEAVKLLPDAIEAKHKYKMEKKLVAVQYESVDEAVKEIWERKPELVIHCGVHGYAKCVHVEKLAYNHKFRRPDYSGKHLDNCSACLVNCTNGPENDVIRCGLNVRQICDKVADFCACDPGQKILRPSNDVGDYLCGYIYLKSLDMNRNRTLFVHVPPIGKPFSSEKTSEILLKIIEECIRQVEASVQCK